MLPIVPTQHTQNKPVRDTDGSASSCLLSRPPSPSPEPASEGHPSSPAGRDFPMSSGSPARRSPPPCPPPLSRRSRSGDDRSARGAQGRAAEDFLRPKGPPGRLYSPCQRPRPGDGSAGKWGRGDGRHQAPPLPSVHGGSLSLVKRRPAGERAGGDRREEERKARG